METVGKQNKGEVPSKLSGSGNRVGQTLGWRGHNIVSFAMSRMHWWIEAEVGHDVI